MIQYTTQMAKLFGEATPVAQAQDGEYYYLMILPPHKMVWKGVCKLEQDGSVFWSGKIVIRQRTGPGVINLIMATSEMMMRSLNVRIYEPDYVLKHANNR